MTGNISRYLFFGILIMSSLYGASQPVYEVRKPGKFSRIFSIDLQEVDAASNQSVTSGKAASLYVYMFLSPECPLCRHYIPQLKKLQELYKDRLIIKGIFPGRAYSADTLKAFSREYGINFPLYIDPDKTLTMYLSVSVTPEVMVFTKDAEKIYAGAIDDWLKELGQMRVRASRMYLDDAISAALAGKKITVPQTNAKGCLVNDL